tara:strand:- start:379 stop:1134 length:756 start_codon:yes stop_codon:yes gene_type:complete
MLDCNHINGHERDGRCQFFPTDHIYKIDGNQYNSVTTLVSKFFPVFDAEEAILKMKNGRNWNPSHRYWGLQDYIIKQMWEEKGIEASKKGTLLHDQIEKFYLGKNYQEPQEFGLFLKFHDEHMFLEPYRTEWRIFDEEYQVSGTIDFIAKNDTHYEMYDWKRSLKIVDSISGKPIVENRWEKGLFGFDDMGDTAYNHYTVQLSLYRYILEKNYQLEVSKMFLVVLHPDYKRYYKVEVPYLKDRVEYILRTL